LIGYVVRRVALLVLTLLLASLVIYGAMQFVPGDPILAMFFPRLPSEQVYNNMREQLGLDKPFLVRYTGYLGGILSRGDLGASFKQGRPVKTIIAENIGHTAQLAVGGLLVALILGIPIGFYAAVTRHRILDNALMVIALVGVSAPSFWLGILLILVFSLGLGWFPTSGIGGFATLVLPSFTLGLYGAGYLARFARSSVLEVKHADYVTTARSKGLSERQVNLKHVFRNALIPVVTMAGLLVGYMMGGAVIVETVFGRSGLGHVLVNAITQKDFPLVQGVLLVTVSIFCTVNLLVDLSYAYIDPRVKY
jgi:peptide/nickel transport system permease protein